MNDIDKILQHTAHIEKCFGLDARHRLLLQFVHFLCSEVKQLRTAEAREKVGHPIIQADSSLSVDPDDYQLFQNGNDK